MSDKEIASTMAGGMVDDLKKFAFMQSAPRFGYSHNIAQLASADMARRWEYANGIFAFCIFFLSFFIIWAFATLVFKWVGMRRVGCLSGQVAFQPNDLYLSESEIGKRHRKIQFAFIFCCGLLFTGGGIILKHGLPTIDVAVRETLALNMDVKMLLDVGMQIANSADILRANFLSSRIHEMLLSDNYCDNTNITVASILLDPPNSNYTEESMKVFDDFQSVLREEKVDGVKSGLLHIIQNLHHFDNMLEFYNSHHWITRMFLLALFNFCLFMLGSAAVTMAREESFQPLTFMTAYFVLPLFMASIFVVWLVTTLIASAAIMNSDFCVGNGGGPESTIENALLENGFNIGDLTFKSFKYFESDCTESKPWAGKVAQYREMIQDGVDVSTFLLSRIDEIGDGKLMSMCGRDFIPVISEIDEAKRDLLLLSSNIDKALEMSRCERVAPLYKRFFNGPTCTMNLQGLSWTFYGLFSVCVTGAIIFAIRSALYQIKVVHVDGDESLCNTMEQAKEIKQSTSKMGQTVLSVESDCNMQPENLHEDYEDSIDSIEKNEEKPLTPTAPQQTNCNGSIDFNSPTSSLSSHLSDNFGTAHFNQEVTSPMVQKGWGKDV